MTERTIYAARAGLAVCATALAVASKVLIAIKAARKMETDIASLPKQVKVIVGG
jgi:hypothetical protein